MNLISVICYSLDPLSEWHSRNARHSLRNNAQPQHRSFTRDELGYVADVQPVSTLEPYLGILILYSCARHIDKSETHEVMKTD